MRSLEGFPGFEVSAGLPEDYLAARDDPIFFFQLAVTGITRYLLELAAFEFSYEFALGIFER